MDRIFSDLDALLSAITVEQIKEKVAKNVSKLDTEIYKKEMQPLTDFLFNKDIKFRPSEKLNDNEEGILHVYFHFGPFHFNSSNLKQGISTRFVNSPTYLSVADNAKEAISSKVKKVDADIFKLKLELFVQNYLKPIMKFPYHNAVFIVKKVFPEKEKYFKFSKNKKILFLNDKLFDKNFIDLGFVDFLDMQKELS